MENENYSTIKVERYGFDIKVNVSSLAKSLAEKLNKEIEKGNDTTAFMIAVSIAAFKDFIDIIAALTLIEVILPGTTFAVGLFLTSFLFFFMLGKGWFLRWKIRFWYWVLGLFVDGIPLVSALPMNTLLVLYAWRITRKRAERGKLKLKNLNDLTENEIAALNNDISLLEQNEEQIKRFA